MKEKSASRREFLRKSSALAAGSLAVGAGFPGAVQAQTEKKLNRLPREVWIATVSQMDLSAETPEEMTSQMIQIMKKSVVYQPDIICLPEVFPFSNVTKKLKLPDKVAFSKNVIEQFLAFAKENSCYVICPVYTRENGHVFNSSVFIDRQGKQLGSYHKIHPTEGELDAGISPGPLKPPVFETDFGTIGVQICFDLLWNNGWNALQKQGAEIVFFPAAYSGGIALNAKAWENKYVVVSSTRKNTAKICDISGETLAETGSWDKNLICAPVNLDKAFLHTWPAVKKFESIRQKYGRKIKITNYDEEEWSIIESRSPEIKVKDILKEFNLKSHEQHTHDAETAQISARKNM